MYGHERHASKFLGYHTPKNTLVKVMALGFPNEFRASRVSNVRKGERRLQEMAAITQPALSDISAKARPHFRREAKSRCDKII